MTTTATASATGKTTSLLIPIARLETHQTVVAAEARVLPRGYVMLLVVASIHAKARRVAQTRTADGVALVRVARFAPRRVDAVRGSATVGSAAATGVKESAGRAKVVENASMAVARRGRSQATMSYSTV